MTAAQGRNRRRPTALCPSCGRHRQLRGDGLIRQHTRPTEGTTPPHGEPCPGSNQQPEETPDA